MIRVARRACSTSGCRSSPAARSTTTRTRPVSHARPRPRRRARRRHADRVGAPRPPLRREARHARHVDRRPHRRGRPDQGRRGSLPLRRAHDPLRPRAAHQPRHLRHQRAARPRRAHPGRSAQRARRARRADPRLQDPPAARRAARRVGEPRGLHQPRPHHHAAEGPLRFADPHALPARDRARDGDHRPGGARRSPATGLQVVGARLHDRDRRRDLAARAALAARQPALGRVGAAVDLQLRDAGRQRGPPRAARSGETRGRAAGLRPRRRWPRRRRARSRSRRSTTAARARCSSAS